MKLEPSYTVEQMGDKGWYVFRQGLDRKGAFFLLNELREGLAKVRNNQEVLSPDFRANLEKMEYRIVKVEVCERKFDMGNRMKLKTLIEFISKFDPESEVAYQVGGSGPNGCSSSAYKLLEVWERPVDEHPILFLNIVAE